MLSQYNKNMIEDLKKKDIKIVMGNCKKLTPNLMNKERYVCNIRNLKKYIELGLKLTKIHRIIQFEQKNFLKEYIDLNTNMR